MNKIKILHTGDIHLKETGSEASSGAFSRIIELAQQEQVDAMIIAGDLFDSSFASLSIKNYLTATFGQIPQIKIFLVAGNHDSLPTYKDVVFPPNVHLFGKNVEKVSLDGVDVYGVSMPYNYAETSLISDFKVDDPDKINLLIVHGDLNGSSPYNPFTAAQIEKSGVDYAALGHIHNSLGLQKCGSAHYAYCGVPQGRGFDEQGSKGVYIGEVYKGHANLEFVKTSSFEFEEIDVDITGAGDYGQICRLIEQCTVKSNGYKIHLRGVFSGGFPLVPEHIANAITGYHRIKIIDNTGEKVDIDALKKEYSLKGLFVKHVLEDTNDEDALEYGLAALDGKTLDISL